MGIIIYTKNGCPHCDAAKRHFTENGMEFEEINLSVFPERIPEIKALAQTAKVPVILDNGSVAIGFNGGS